MHPGRPCFAQSLLQAEVGTGRSWALLRELTRECQQPLPGKLCGKPPREGRGASSLHCPCRSAVISSMVQLPLGSCGPRGQGGLPSYAAGLSRSQRYHPPWKTRYAPGKRRDNGSVWQDTLGITEKAQFGLTVYRGHVYCSRAQASHF